MKKELIGLDMATLKPVYKKVKSKSRVWRYQFRGGEVQTIIKEGKWWYYNSEIGGEVGCDTLSGAKEDLIYSGAKVWMELIND